MNREKKLKIYIYHRKIKINGNKFKQYLVQNKLPFKLLYYNGFKEPIRIKCKRCGFIIDDRTSVQFKRNPLCPVCDPHFLQRMSGSANSSKRDRLKMEDYNLIKEKENKYGITPISWFASEIWSKMENSVHNNDELRKYRTILKQNMNAFMECLWVISNETDGEKGKDFLTRVLLKPKESYFRYNYHFDPINGSYDKTPKKVSKQLTKEYERYIRVSFQSVDDYHNKNNRHIKLILNKREQKELESLCEKINTNVSDSVIFSQFVLLNKSIQNRLLRE